MIRLRVEGDKLNDLVAYISISASEDAEVCKASVVREIDNRRVGFFVFEGFYFRTQRSVSCSVFLYQTDLNSCEIIIVGAGGATAVGITWGAQKDIEKKMSEAILDYARNLGMKADYSSSK
jgi:hypothetical protein